MVSLISPAAPGAMAPPPTPLTKRPVLGQKRDSSYLDTDDENGLSSSTKKLKVAFSPNVDIRTIIDDWDEKSFDLVKEEVRIGVERHLAPSDSRDDTQYTKLLQLLGQDVRSEDAASSKLLKKYIVALDAKVSALGNCGQLAMTTVDLSWLGRDDIFVGWYVKFLCSLATTHTKFVQSIMDKLVAYFTKLPASLGRLAGEQPVSRAAMFARVHLAIKTILRQVPSAASALTRALKFEFPNDLATTRSYLQYQRHLIQLARNVPEITAEILALITQRLVNIDVQIQLDLEDLEDEAEDGLLGKGDRREEDDSDDSDSDSMSESELTTTDEEQRIKEIRAKIAKMDGTLDLLFEYYTPLVEQDMRPETNDGFQQLLTHFQTFVMPSRTRHAQFLLFHFSQTSSRHVALFVQRCLEISMAPGPVSQRLTACAYMSSFMARGTHVTRHSVRDVFNALCNFLESMRIKHEPGCRGPDKRAYAVYYAVAQAVLYIFCFRWRDLVDGAVTPEPDDEGMSADDILAEGRELVWLPGIKEALQKSIYSSLNPLKVCSPAIVGEFAKIANHLRFLYVFPKLETNKRLRLGHITAYYSNSGLPEIGRRETAFDRKAGEAHLQLEAYFPFDPYHLPISKRWVEGDYNQWKLPAGMQDDDEDDNDDEEDELEEDSDDDSLPEDFDGEVPLHDTLSVSS